METRKVRDVLIRVKDKEGKEGWIPLSEIGRALVETFGEVINEVSKELGKNITKAQKERTKKKGRKNDKTKNNN